MKIKYIHLPAFGVFANERLDFARDRGLHIVYGPNEAGKSTILEAVGDALFGIPSSSPYAFAHRAAELKSAIGLELADGTDLEFLRLRRNRGSLVGPDGSPLSEDILASILGGFSRTDFENMFSLSHLRLRQGGRGLLRSGGSVGQSLFQAASGIHHLNLVFTELDKEAEKLYSRQSRKRDINVLADEYQQRRWVLDQAPLSFQVFTALEEEYRGLIKQLEEAAAKLRSLRRRQARLQRITRTKPILVQRRACLEELQSLGELRPLAPGSAGRWQGLTAEMRSAAEAQEKTQAQLESLQNDLAGLHVPTLLLAHDDQVENLYRELEKYAQAVADKPLLEQKIAGLERTAQARLRELHPKAEGLEQAEEYRRALIAVAEVRALAQEHEELQHEREKAVSAVESREEDLNRTRRELERFGPLRDTGRLQALTDSIRAKGDLEQQYQDKLMEIQQLETRLTGQMKRLPGWKGTLEELAARELPLPETTAAYAQEQRRLLDELRAAAQAVKALDKQCADLQLEIERSRVEEWVPTEAELAAAREHRDRGWKLVKRSWLDQQPDAEAERAFALDKPLAEAYEDSVARADDIADELRRASGQVAKLQALERQLQALNAELADRRMQEQRLQKELDAFNQRWNQLWSGSGVEPLSPEPMGAWLRQAQSIVSGWEQLMELRAAAAALRGQIDAYRTALVETLGALGEDGRGSLSELAAQAASICKAEEGRRGEHKRLTESAAEQADAWKRERARLEAADAALAEWRQRWSQAMAAVGLPAAASVSAVLAYLDKLTELFELVDKLREERAALQGQQAYIAGYEARVQGVVHRTGTAVSLEDTSQAVRTLMGMLSQGRQNMATRNSIEKQIENLAAHAADYQERIARAQQELAQMMASAGCSTCEQMEEVLRRHSRAEELREKLERLEEELLRSGDGLSLAELVEEAAAVEADSIPAELEELEGEIARSEELHSDLNRRLGAKEKEYLEKVGGSSTEAVEAAEQAQDVLARLAAAVEKYLNLKLQSLILKRAVERYREEHQDPVLKRAGEIFQALTGGSFAGLVVDYDGKENAVIKGLRAGQAVGVDGMSDGTQDQLYLALRLAAVELYLSQREPLPFIVDDVLVNFDDERAAAALQALAELSEKTQVIMFTHHLRIVEMAGAVLPRDRYAVYTLDRKEWAGPAAVQALKRAR